MPSTTCLKLHAMSFAIAARTLRVIWLLLGVIMASIGEWLGCWASGVEAPKEPMRSPVILRWKYQSNAWLQYHCNIGWLQFRAVSDGRIWFKNRLPHCFIPDYDTISVFLIPDYGTISMFFIPDYGTISMFFIADYDTNSMRGRLWVTAEPVRKQKARRRTTCGVPK